MINLSFCPWPRVEISSDAQEKFKVQFIDDSTGHIVYETELGAGHWAEPHPKYFVPWRVVTSNGETVLDQKMSLKGQRVLIVLNSKALGDTIAWMAPVLRFQEKHKCKVIVQTYWNSLFESEYPELTFEEPSPILKRSDYYAAYIIGCFDDDQNRNRTNWRSVPLQQVASDFLGLDYHCERPRINRSPLSRQIAAPYVAISEFAHGYLAKQWLNPGGWQAVVYALSDRGFKVVSVSREPSNLNGVIKLNDRSIDETIHTIQHAHAFIGVSSGPSWLAWALGVPTVVVSGFSSAWAESPDMLRVIDETVCHGCFNDASRPIERANTMYCPRGQNMICSKAITPESVLEAVDTALRRRVMLVIPHCSTGGMPQYVLRQAQDLISHGFAVGCIEVRNISDAFTVQRKKLKALLGQHYYCADGDGEDLLRIIEDFSPAMVHLHEPAESMLSDDVSERLFACPRKYKIALTLHCAELPPTRYWPDAFSFVGWHHADLSKEELGKRGIPWNVCEYSLPKRTRPDRTEALTKLGLDPAQKHVLHVGLFAPWKNQAAIFEAAQWFHGVQFHFVGNQAENFKDYWSPLKGDNCKIWGERDDVDSFYGAMDLFVFPSTNECNPIAVKEALSWGMPVLLSPLPQYCGMYDNNPRVDYIDIDLAEKIMVALA